MGWVGSWDQRRGGTHARVTPQPLVAHGTDAVMARVMTSPPFN